MFSEKQPLQRSNTRYRIFKGVIHILIAGAFLTYLYRLFESVPEPQPSVEAILEPERSSQFRLKHVFHHGAGKYNKIHRRLDVTPEVLENRQWKVQHTPEKPVDPNNADSVLASEEPSRLFKDQDPWTAQLQIKTAEKPARLRRLKERHTPHFLDSYLQYAMEVKGNPQKLNRIGLEWEPEQDVLLPDVEDKDSVVALALISSNAYVRLPLSDDEKDKLDWVDVGDPWDVDEENPDINFGWLEDGLRGHVFVSNDSKTVVIGIKGTSGAGLPGGGSDETSGNDKTNDNLLFSCCCARVGYMWTTVCDCYEKTYTCNQDCLEKELLRQDRYYQAALDLYRNVTKLYPPEDHDIWVTGHSLGGAVASLLGRTYGLPVVAFEAPGEMLATKRLHLPQAPGIPKHMEHIWHFGNTADPIFMGVCNGASSSCSVAGYAMETACHTGKLCVYDVVGDLGWHVNLLNHRIHTVIDEIILKYNKTATCVDQPPCRDCFNWRYISKDDNEPDEPRLPHPLKPKPPKSSSTQSSTPTDSATSTPTESEKPKKCLERTWYGWCKKWEGDED
ncbi:hypothetical protein C7M61_001972 [Candidozyma pseudohaemuli]|uniref:Putative lipase ATG15 n=1 Tax=Candidozyma pseudohaemuli TaxID=418784 RepID=A0A2P7YTS7_9ASCO|nr:hypothetical protein C7M61_001972 [[Candida] pseudohaemulonii]PSK39361.1 hypothetical protein C7M61_001972 [[Candida] pseudohaemulonii]